MSYLSSLNNKVLPNLFYNNNLCSIDLSGNNFSSIDYVDTNISNIDLTTQTNQLIQLQNELNLIIAKLPKINDKNKRIIGSITTSFLLTAPPNYLICNGSSLLVSEYQSLFNIIGYNYGGSGASFNLPDFRSFYILGGNNNINNISVSNLFSGNGTTGGTNTFLKFGSVFPSGFPLLTEICNHTHNVLDFGHTHLGWTETQPFSTVGTQGFIKQANQDGNFNVGSSKTGITLNTYGTDIQQIDLNSGKSGVNITPPFISCTFLICYI